MHKALTAASARGLVGCSSTPPAPRATVWPTTAWATSTPEAEGFDAVFTGWNSDELAASAPDDALDHRLKTIAP